MFPVFDTEMQPVQLYIQDKGRFPRVEVQSPQRCSFKERPAEGSVGALHAPVLPLCVAV